MSAIDYLNFSMNSSISSQVGQLPSSVSSSSSSHAAAVNLANMTQQSNRRNNRMKSIFEHIEDVNLITMDATSLSLALWHLELSKSKRENLANFIHKLLHNHMLRVDDLCFGPTATATAAVSSDACSGRTKSRSQMTAGDLVAIDMDSGIWKTYLSRDVTSLCYRRLLVHRQLRTRYEGILKSLLLQFSAPSPAVRSRVVKSLAALMQVDDSLITRAMFRDAITERLHDVAISVREECVKLIGSFVLKGSETSQLYLDALILCLKDVGVSVRKSTILIFRDILLSQPSNPR